MVQHLVSYHFAKQLPIYVINPKQRITFGQEAWAHCARYRAVLILDRMEIYAEIVQNVKVLVEMQSILISTGTNGWNRINLVSTTTDVRLLVIDVGTPSLIRFYAWRQGSEITQRTANELTIDECWHRDALNTQLFWGRVRDVHRMPQFRARLVPPLHINACANNANVSPECHVIGPFVFLVNLLTERLCRWDDHNECRPAVNIRNAEDGYDEWFGGYFSATLPNGSDLLTSRHVRDAVQQRRPAADDHHQQNIVVTIGSDFGRLRIIRMDDVVLIVPAERNYYRTEWYMNIFRVCNILGCFSVIILAATVQYGSVRLWKNAPVPSSRNYTRIVLDAFARTLGNITSSEPLLGAHRRPTERTIMLTLSLYSMLASAFITSNMLLHSINNIQMDQIEALDEWFHGHHHANRSLRVPADFEPYLMGINGDMEWQTLHEIQSQLWSHNTDAAWIMGVLDTVLLRMSHLRHSNGEPVYHVAKRIIGNCCANIVSKYSHEIALLYFFYPGKRPLSFRNVPWYLVQPINELITRMHESGMLQYFETITAYVFGLMNRNRLSGRDASDGSIEGNIWVFIFVFESVLLGISTLVFAIECCICKRRVRK